MVDFSHAISLVGKSDAESPGCSAAIRGVTSVIEWPGSDSGNWLVELLQLLTTVFIRGIAEGAQRESPPRWHSRIKAKCGAELDSESGRVGLALSLCGTAASTILARSVMLQRV